MGALMGTPGPRLTHPTLPRTPIVPALLGAILAALLGAAPPGVAVGRVAAADGVSFDPPSATAVLLQPLVFRDTFRSPQRPLRAELILTTPYVLGATVQAADLTSAAGGAWQVAVTQPDAGSVNTVYRYAFRVTLPGGVMATSPSGTVTVADPRFAWQAISGPTITLHWYGESGSTARRWLQAGEAAVTRAATAFGIPRVAHLDFFIYGASKPFFDAIGAGANADAAGVYLPATHTAFGTVLPSDLGSSWPDQEIAHEVTHHVFEVATHNPYHAPPFWLDEGLAVYYSEGPGPRSADLRLGIVQGRIIPLDGLSGAFPATTDAFALSYAEAVSAVDFFLRTYGRTALPELIATYAHGATDDEAFRAATGGNAAAFDAAWLAAIGVSPPPAYGPRPAPAGPLPPGWSISPTPGAESAFEPPLSGRAAGPSTAPTDTVGTGAVASRSVPAAPLLPALVLLAIISSTVASGGVARRGPGSPGGWRR